jgi:hypothetical protein
VAGHNKPLAAEFDARACPRLSWRSLGALDYGANSGGKLIDTRARHNNGIASPMRFLGNPQEFSPVVLAEFHVEMLAFDLQLPRLDEIVHFLNEPASLVQMFRKMEEDFARNGGR